MQERHRPRLDLAAARGQPAALDQFVALAQMFDETGDLAKVIAVVGIAHQHPAASGRLDTAHQGRAVAPFRYRHNPCAKTRGNRL